MGSRKSQNLIVGTVVLVALFILVFGMAFLNEYAPGKRMDGYVLVANEVGLLAQDDPVKFNGVKVGKVKSIELAPDKRVRIEIEVQAGSAIPVGSKVQIQNVGLMGERMINIALKADEPKAYPVGAVIPAGYDFGIAETMGVAGELVLQAQAMLRQLQTVVDSTVGRPDFAPRINAVVDRADQVSERLDRLVAELEPKVRGAAGDLSSAGRTARLLVERSAPSVDSVVTRVDRASAEATPLVADLKATSADIRDLVGRARSGQSTLGKLATDTVFYRELSAAVVRADSLLKRVQTKGLDVNIDLW